MRLFQGHLQTLVGHFLPSDRLRQKSTRWLVPLQDGDQLSVHYYAGQSDCVISLYHGLSGSIEADYMQRTALQYLKLGHHVVLVNHRGAGDGEGLAKQFYHSGRAEDVSQVLQFLRQKLPGKKQIAAGFSMSGNILLYLLSGQRGEHQPEAAIAVNAPINLKASALLLKEGFNRCYDFRFVKLLSRQRQLAVPFGATVYDFDELHTARMCGFKNREDYYQTCSAKPHVGKITVPTHVLTAKDDPFVPYQDYMEAPWSPQVELTIHGQGGHLGYVTAKKNQLGSYRWLDQYMVESLEKILHQI